MSSHSTDKCRFKGAHSISFTAVFRFFSRTFFTKATGSHKNECFSLSQRLAHFKRSNLFDPHMKEPALSPAHGNNGQKMTKATLLRKCEMLTRELNVNIRRVKEDIKHSVSGMRFCSLKDWSYVMKLLWLRSLRSYFKCEWQPVWLKITVYSFSF